MPTTFDAVQAGKADTDVIDHMTDKPRLVGFRIYICVTSLLVSVLGVLSPDRLYPHAADSREIFLVSWALALVGVSGILDAFINDVLPEQFYIRCLSGWREKIYLVIAMLYASLIFLAAKDHAENAHMIQYAFNVFACVWIAFYDVQYRYVEPRRKSQ